MSQRKVKCVILLVFLKNFFLRPPPLKEKTEKWTAVANERIWDNLVENNMSYSNYRCSFPANRSMPLWHRLIYRLYSMAMELHPQAGGCEPCQSRVLQLEDRICLEFNADFPVDAVYTWVDGSDREHAAKRASCESRQSDIHDNGLEEARFRDNDELRYSLRALDAYAPWLRSIILVTDNQFPVWLNRDHPKIRVVDHREFIPERCLPTFNSHVIEAYLHAVPGLAEHYIYLNDDVFLARPSRKTEFFTPNGLPLTFTDWRVRRRDGYREVKTPHAHSYHNTLHFLRARNALRDPDFIAAHGPYPQTRANATEAFAFFKEAIEAFDENRFRTTNEMAMYCHVLPSLMYARKRLVPCDERYFYIMSKRKDRVAHYTAILRSQSGCVPPLFFCVNDVGGKGRSPQWRTDMRTFLDAYFPQASSFELPDGFPGR